MSEYKNYFKNIGIVGFTNLAIALRGIILLPVITKLLGPLDYGIWSQIGVTISLITPLAVLGLPGALVRFLAGEKNQEEVRENISSILFLVFSISLIIVLALVMFSVPISHFFQTFPLLINILALTIVFECLNAIFFGLLQAFEKINKYSALTIFQNFGEIGLVVSAVLLGLGLSGAVFSLLLIRAIVFLISSVIVLKRFGLTWPKFHFLRKYLAFGLPTVLSNFSYWIITSSNRYIINFFGGSLAVGYFSPAYTVGSVLVFLIYPFSFMLPIVLSKNYNEGNSEVVKIYLRYSLKYFLILAIPGFCGLSVLARQLLVIFSTPAIAEESQFIVPFIAMSFLLYGFYTILVQILTLAKKTKLVGLIWASSAIITVGLNFLLLPKIGIIGAAITSLVSYLFAFILIFNYSFKEIKFEIEKESIFKSIAASLLMTVFIILFYPQGLAKTLLVIVVSAIFYATLMFLFQVLKKNEIEFLKNFLTKGKI